MTVFRIHALLLTVFLSAVCWAQPALPPITPAQYRADLDRLVEETQGLQASGQVAKVMDDLPVTWHVQGEAGQFDIQTDGLRRDLHNLQEKFSSSLQERIATRLQTMRADVDAYEKPAADISRQRAALTAILARPEFNDAHGPDWIERLKLRILEWLFRQLGRLFGSSSIPTVGKVLVYSLVGLAVLVVAIWVYRSIRSAARMERVVPEGEAVSAKEWTVWMAEARAAAGKGSWRDAIHLAYWGGISFLEAGGMWRPDRARTPREYLRLLPAASEHRPPLTALTREFEVVWYGNQNADAQAFSQTLEELEKLGCR